MHKLFIPTTTTTPKPFTSSSSQPRGSSTPTNPFLLLSSLRWDPPLPSPPPTSLFPSHPNNNPNPLTLPNKTQTTHHLLLTCTPNVPSLIRRPLSPQTSNSKTVPVPKSGPSSTPLRIMVVLQLSSSDSINSVSSLTKTLSMELADGQTAVSYCHKLRCNKSTGHTQPSNGPLASFHGKVETHLDPTKELKRLISECKYDEAFTIELQRSDVAIVSRLCSPAFLILSSSVLVDLQGIMSLLPLPLGQGGSIALSATAAGL